MGITACDDSSARKARVENDKVQREKSKERLENVHKSKKRDSEATVKAAELLKALHALSSDEFDTRLENFDEVKVWLAKIDTDVIESLLTKSGFKEKEDGWQSLFETYCKAKAELDPKAYVNWLIGDKKDKIRTMISYLARCEPALAADVVTRSALDNTDKSSSYGQVFETASATDPERSVQVFESTEFEKPNLKNRAMIAVISGVNRETTTPQMMAQIMSGFSERSLSSFPQAVGQAGGAIVENTAENVLAHFPLDRKPWERVVAISFLETKAYRGATGDGDITEFLKSEQANLLTDSERGRLHKILGK